MKHTKKLESCEVKSNSRTNLLMYDVSLIESGQGVIGRELSIEEIESRIDQSELR